MNMAIIIYYTLFFMFFFTHLRHATTFQGSSQGFLLALHLSVSLGAIFGLGFLIWYGFAIAWYWPLVLFVVGYTGVIVSEILYSLVGVLTISLLGFLGWPICGFLMILSVRSIA